MGDLVTVATYTGPIEAHIAKGRLESEGIAVFLADEHHVWANWVYSNALGGVKLLVAVENVDQAQTILQKHSDGEFEADLQQEFPGLKEEECPHCGSKDFKSTLSLWSLGLVILTLGLVSVIFPLRQENRICLTCRHKWKQ
jgi:hypothetical protein